MRSACGIIFRGRAVCVCADLRGGVIEGPLPLRRVAAAGRRVNPEAVRVGEEEVVLAAARVDAQRLLAHL